MAEYLPHQAESEYPDPRELVDYRWREDNPDAYDAVLEHLAKGQPHAAYKGSSVCRICGITNGSEELTDGVYFWPTGYAHYIRDHGVRPPTLFVRHVLGTKLRSKVSMIGVSSGRLSSAGPNLSNIPRPDHTLYEMKLRFRVPTYREEVEILNNLQKGQRPPANVLLVGGKFIMVEDYPELLAAVLGAYEQNQLDHPLPDISAILEENSVKGPVESFQVNIEGHIREDEEP